MQNVEMPVRGVCGWVCASGKTGLLEHIIRKMQCKREWSESSATILEAHLWKMKNVWWFHSFVSLQKRNRSLADAMNLDWKCATAFDWKCATAFVSAVSFECIDINCLVTCASLSLIALLVMSFLPCPFFVMICLLWWVLWEQQNNLLQPLRSHDMTNQTANPHSKNVQTCPMDRKLEATEVVCPQQILLFHRHLSLCKNCLTNTFSHVRTDQHRLTGTFPYVTHMHTNAHAHMHANTHAAPNR